MATALSPLMLSAPAPVPRPVMLRPVSAGEAGGRSGRGPKADADGLREDELRRLYGSDLGDPSFDKGPQARQAEVSEDPKEESERNICAPAGMGDTAFLAQLLSQDEPAPEGSDPFGDASRAYERFHAERHMGMVIDLRDPVDVTV